MMESTSKIRAHYVVSTHWDREWYQSFQNFRYQLVQLLDQVFDGLEDGRMLGPFQTDGQSIILEDFLEIRPDQRQRVEDLAQAGRLVIGPWYVLPDEFLVSGESLIRNLRTGRAFPRSFGAQPSNAGFVCDLFGHNSQMPQIFAGFGIHGGFVWRGLNNLQTRHVRWIGADGSELTCYRFPAGGYCDYTFEIRHARDHAAAHSAQRVQTDLQRYLEYEAEHTEVDPILLFDGGDHEAWDQDSYEAMVQFKEAGTDGAALSATGAAQSATGAAQSATGAAQSASDFELLHTSLDAYLEEVLPQKERIGSVVRGELREPGRYFDDQQWVIPGVLSSSRVWIKQANAECESLLCQWAEPLSSLASLTLDQEMPHGFLDVAWKWLLKNHPHDSICGCSIDVVHEDMKFRFSQTRQIADRLTLESTRKIAASIAGGIGSDELRVVVFNPLPVDLDETVELDLQIPQDRPHFNEFFGFEPKPAFHIYGADDDEVPYQRLAQTRNRNKLRIYETKFPQSYLTHDVGVSLPLRLPALGYTTLTLRPDQNGAATRHAHAPGLATSERSMENGILAVAVESNGSLTLLDKRTGETYRRLLTFENGADIGDGWYHGQSVNDQVFASTASPASVALVHDGRYLTTFRIRTTMQVPEHFQFDDRMQRSDRMVDLIIQSDVSLRPGSDRLEVTTVVHNTAADHRLRVLFPSGADAQTYLADTPFDAVERPIALNPQNHLYRELEVETKPQQTWTAVHQGRRGLAIVSSGLLESAVRDVPERTLALTLFRSTRRTVHTDGEPEGLLMGALKFRYWIVPLAGEPDIPLLFQMGQQLAAGCRAVQLRARDQDLHASGRVLSPVASFLRVNGRVVTTSVRRLKSGIEVRIFNPTSREVEISLEWGADIGYDTVQSVDFESNPTGDPVPMLHNGIEWRIAAKKIVTLCFS